ncbi:MAG: DUF86 domain-containing protein [Candidatus Omnitrophota bacterium]
MKREHKDYIADIVNAITEIEEFTKGLTFAEFEKDKKTVFAVIRALEIIGEAAKKIPLAIKSKHKNIPWKQIAGMRDKLVHEYFGVNVEVIWKTITEDIPPLKPLIERLSDSSQK